MNPQFKKTIIFISGTILIIFLLQYNLVPLQINTQIQRASFLADNKKCEEAFNVMEKVLGQRSFLDAYLRVKYVENIKTCAEFYPEKNLEYAIKGVELMKEAVKTRPLYSRLWLFLGSFTTIKANAEQNPEAKANLLKEAGSFFDKASQLAPNHQEILTESAKADMVAKNYQAMKEKSEKCIALDPKLGDCYWTKALSEIYLKDFENAEKDIQLAQDNRFQTNSISSLHQLALAYAVIENFKELAIVYEKLIEINPETAQYHSSLAFTYYNLREYKKAREEAAKFLELMPEAKDEVNAFLKTLPY